MPGVARPLLCAAVLGAVISVLIITLIPDGWLGALEHRTSQFLPSHFYPGEQQLAGNISGDLKSDEIWCGVQSLASPAVSHPFSRFCCALAALCSYAQLPSDSKIPVSNPPQISAKETGRGRCRTRKGSLASARSR